MLETRYEVPQRERERVRDTTINVDRTGDMIYTGSGELAGSCPDVMCVVTRSSYCHVVAMVTVCVSSLGVHSMLLLW